MLRIDAFRRIRSLPPAFRGGSETPSIGEWADVTTAECQQGLPECWTLRTALIGMRMQSADCRTPSTCFPSPRPPRKQMTKFLRQRANSSGGRGYLRKSFALAHVSCEHFHVASRGIWNFSGMWWDDTCSVIMTGCLDVSALGSRSCLASTR